MKQDILKLLVLNEISWCRRKLCQSTKQFVSHVKLKNKDEALKTDCFSCMNMVRKSNYQRLRDFLSIAITTFQP